MVRSLSQVDSQHPYLVKGALSVVPYLTVLQEEEVRLAPAESALEGWTPGPIQVQCSLHTECYCAAALLLPSFRCPFA